MPPTWRASDVQCVLPMERVRAIWDRADQLGRGRGGRFDKHDDAVDVWSAKPGRGKIGSFHVWWGAPTERDATIFRLEWDSSKAAEPDLWREIEGLAGGPLPR